jgi:hypothetical protein
VVIFLNNLPSEIGINVLIQTQIKLNLD